MTLQHTEKLISILKTNGVNYFDGTHITSGTNLTFDGTSLTVAGGGTFGSALMVNPVFKEGTPSMFICGNNDKAKKTVAGIVEQFGFTVEDMGAVENPTSVKVGPVCG